MHLHCARLAAFLVIATHRPTRLTGFTRVIIIYSLGLPPSLPPSSIILLPLPLPYPPLSYKRQVDLLTCAERLADDFWEEHLHAGRLGRLPRKTSAHNYWHERDGRPRQQYQYPLPDTVLHPFPVIRALYLPKRVNSRTIPISRSRLPCVILNKIFLRFDEFFSFFFQMFVAERRLEIWQRFSRTR